ncbi:MAG: hypothetical protein P4M00_23850 [Azospirillaceae bacterium]|nr:hypothetical protein [Azospirillaceae bacterium]
MIDLDVSPNDPLVGILLFSLLAVWPFWRILQRAGLRPWYALLVLIPGLGQILVLMVLGHSRWPTLPPLPPKPQPRRPAALATAIGGKRR